MASLPPDMPYMKQGRTVQGDQEEKHKNTIKYILQHVT